jgi:hypothetical protein
VSDEGDIAEFARRWVQAASEAAGACAKVQADLEALESQGELINLLAASSQGISDSRKKLTSLGPNPTVEGVRGVLQVVHCRQLRSFVSHTAVLACGTHLHSTVMCIARPASLWSRTRSTSRLPRG